MIKVIQSGPYTLDRFELQKHIYIYVYVYMYRLNYIYIITCINLLISGFNIIWIDEPEPNKIKRQKLDDNDFEQTTP